MTKNDEAMEAVFNTVDIVGGVEARGWFDITAQELKDITGREPRLLAKIDNASKTPRVMKEYDLSMLAIANGTYRFSKERTHINVPNLDSKRIFPLKEIKGLLSYDLFSNKQLTETQALDKAFNNNIISDCVGERIIPGFRSRRRGTFDLKVGQTLFPVTGVQIEVDGCYESASAIHIFEVKFAGQKDTTIRQLVYPKRMMEGIVKGLKTVHVWLLVFDKKTGVFNFHKFVDKGNHFYFDYDASKRYILK